MERIVNKSKRYNLVSLFSGIGGLDLGFDYAGFNIIWANDFDKYACETYKANINDKIVCGNIRDLIDDIPQHDVLIGGFPCQPFSTLGKLKGFGDATRGTLFFSIKEIMEKYNSNVVVLENVKNLVNHDHGNTFKVIEGVFKELKYSFNYAILDSQDYGVPQRRNRVFIVAFKNKDFKKDKFVYPEKEDLLVSTQDLLDNEVDAKYFLTKKLEKTILGVGTKGYIVKPTIDLPISKTLCATMHKMHRASQDNYVTDIENFNKIHDDNRVPIRKLTPDECRKLQGFPSDWIQVVSDTQAYKQFGNAVTVNVAYRVACKVIEYMDKNRKW